MAVPISTGAPALLPGSRADDRDAHLIRRWVVAFVAAEVVGFGVAAPIAGGGIALLDAATGGWKLLIAILSGVLAGIAEGVAVGWMQWRVIHRVVPAIGRRAWIVATAGSASIAWAIGMTLGSVVAPDTEPAFVLVVAVAAAMGFVLGAILGLGQALVLRRHVDGSGRWVLANGLGWTIGMAVSFAGSGLVGAGSPVALIVATAAMTGAAMALAPALATGVVLVDIAKRARRRVPGSGSGPGSRRALNRVANPVVVRVLRSRLHPLLSRQLALITVTGRRTGRLLALPVGYVVDGRQIVIVSHRDRVWWRNLVGSSPVVLRLRGEDRRAIAEVEQEPGAVATTLRRQGRQLLHKDLAPEEINALANRLVIVRATPLDGAGAESMGAGSETTTGESIGDTES